jgi:nitrous oxide reductase accessory protein NosL
VARNPFIDALTHARPPLYVVDEIACGGKTATEWLLFCDVQLAATFVVNARRRLGDYPEVEDVGIDVERHEVVFQMQQGQELRLAIELLVLMLQRPGH